MAINPNDFIFHSDYTINGLLSSYQETLTTPGVQIAPNTSMTIYGDYHDIGNARSTPVASWIVPSLPQVHSSIATGSLQPGSIRKGGFAVSTSQAGGHNPVGIYFFPFALQSGHSVRSAIKIFNNSSKILTVPVAKWKMKISVYIVPPNIA